MNRFELKEQINTKQEKINSIKRKNPNNLFFKLKVAKNFIDESDKSDTSDKRVGLLNGKSQFDESDKSDTSDKKKLGKNEKSIGRTGRK